MIFTSEEEEEGDQERWISHTLGFATAQYDLRISHLKNEVARITNVHTSH
jgi:hypothetical protein